MKRLTITQFLRTDGGTGALIADTYRTQVGRSWGAIALLVALLAATLALASCGREDGTADDRASGSETLAGYGALAQGILNEAGTKLAASRSAETGSTFSQAASVVYSCDALNNMLDAFQEKELTIFEIGPDDPDDTDDSGEEIQEALDSAEEDINAQIAEVTDALNKVLDVIQKVVGFLVDLFADFLNTILPGLGEVVKWAYSAFDPEIEAHITLAYKGVKGTFTPTNIEVDCVGSGEYELNLTGTAAIKGAKNMSGTCHSIHDYYNVPNVVVWADFDVDCDDLLDWNDPCDEGSGARRDDCFGIQLDVERSYTVTVPFSIETDETGGLRFAVDEGGIQVSSGSFQTTLACADIENDAIEDKLEHTCDTLASMLGTTFQAQFEDVFSDVRADLVVTAGGGLESSLVNHQAGSAAVVAAEGEDGSGHGTNPQVEAIYAINLSSHTPGAAFGHLLDLSILNAQGIHPQSSSYTTVAGTYAANLGQPSSDLMANLSCDALSAIVWQVDRLGLWANLVESDGNCPGGADPAGPPIHAPMEAILGELSVLGYLDYSSVWDNHIKTDPPTTTTLSATSSGHGLPTSGKVRPADVPPGAIRAKTLVSCDPYTGEITVSAPTLSYSKMSETCMEAVSTDTYEGRHAELINEANGLTLRIPFEDQCETNVGTQDGVCREENLRYEIPLTRPLVRDLKLKVWKDATDASDTRTFTAPCNLSFGAQRTGYAGVTGIDATVACKY